MSKPIRILHVFSILDRGGAETMVMNLYRAIDRSRVQFDFIVHREDEGFYEAEIRSLGGRIYRVVPFYGLNYFSYRFRWKKLLTELRKTHHILHSHIRSTASIYFPIANQLGYQTIIHSHAISAGTDWKAGARKIFQASLRRKAQYFLACSTEAATWLFGADIVHSPKYHLLLNSIDVEAFRFSAENRQALRQSLGLTTETVIGHVGRFIELKNHRRLLEIFSEYHTEHPNSALILVGDTDLPAETLPYVQNQVVEFGLASAVHFIGAVDNVGDYLSAMDVFVFPSILEGLGMALVEAQCVGLPTVFSDTLPEEARILQSCQPVSLDCPNQIWVECIERADEIGFTQDAVEQVRKAGYAVEETADWLMDYYENLR